jgi:hypothetical protein
MPGSSPVGATAGADSTLIVLTSKPQGAPAKPDSTAASSGLKQRKLTS